MARQVRGVLGRYHEREYEIQPFLRVDVFRDISEDEEYVLANTPFNVAFESVVLCESCIFLIFLTFIYKSIVYIIFFL